MAKQFINDESIWVWTFSHIARKVENKMRLSFYPINNRPGAKPELSIALLNEPAIIRVLERDFLTGHLFMPDSNFERTERSVLVSNNEEYPNGLALVNPKDNGSARYVDYAGKSFSSSNGLVYQNLLEIEGNDLLNRIFLTQGHCMIKRHPRIASNCFLVYASDSDLRKANLKGFVKTLELEKSR
ncbi:hypothetical protein COU54_05715 [Candidatus Pacearchaeota archaeon CG10_big_fil_rev_8_21_14_0_10_31_24]|nr:MAG: hypothetical protein COU54_05715 [Candidatus Pacearchaeota archaeon CG10_big_fil_rev_8_21_14_0_10_31_24]